MNVLKHTAFYCSGNADTAWLIQEIMHGSRFDFSEQIHSLHGELFTASALQYFIDEEIRHGRLLIDAPFKNTFSKSSNGEQRMALFRHIISKEPDCIIISNLFDSLDAAAKQEMTETLHSISGQTLILQIINRKNDCLSFISEVYTIEDKEIIAKQPAGLFLANAAKQPKQFFIHDIPPPEKEYPLQDDALISMRHLCVHFDSRPILHDINWEVCAGEFWQLKGPNGSGKTTLIAAVTGDSPKGYGQELYLFGNKKGSGETVWDIKEQIGYFSSYMMQQFNGHHTAEQMIVGGFFDSVGLYFIPSSRQLQIAREWLQLLGLNDKAKTAFRKITPAQQRLVLLARAMIKHPPLLILDEPTAGLDDESTGLFTALINKLSAETQTAIIYVSHRDETGLLPQQVFELIPSAAGSTGQVLK